MKSFTPFYVLVFVFFIHMFCTTDSHAQPAPNTPVAGEAGLFGLNVTSEIFAGFGPFIIIQNKQIGNQFFSMFGFDLNLPGQQGNTQWTLSSYYNDPTFITAILDDVWTSMSAGQTWDIGTSVVSSIGASFDAGVTFACFNFEQPTIDEGFPGDDPNNPNITFGGNIDVVCANGVITFGTDLNILLGNGNDLQEFNIQSTGSIELMDGTSLEACFDINNILSPNQFGLPCGSFFQPSFKAKQKLGKNDQWEVSAGVKNPFTYGKLTKELPATVQASVAYKFKL